MSRSAIAAVACRLLAMAMFALAALSVARTVAEMVAGGIGTTTFQNLLESFSENLSVFGFSALGAGSLITGGMWLFCAVYGWFRADELALKMVGDDPEPVTSVRVTADEVLATGCRLIGMVILVGALRKVATLAWAFVLSDSRSFSTFLESGYDVEAVEALLETGLAVWFLLGPRGLVGLVVWARNAGTSRAERADADQASAAESETAENGLAERESSAGRPSGNASAAGASNENHVSGGDSQDSERSAES
jgi:hypothetical protein